MTLAKGGLPSWAWGLHTQSHSLFLQCTYPNCNYLLSYDSLLNMSLLIEQYDDDKGRVSAQDALTKYHRHSFLTVLES